MELSVIIPVYNIEKYIPNTLYSLINQIEKRFEIIIVDDGSTDNTSAIAEEILLNSELTNYKIIKKKNGGVSSARNRGLVEATGKYVFFLDGDDYVSSDFGKDVYKILDNESADIICWHFEIIKEDGKTIRRYFDEYQSVVTNMSGIDALNNIIILDKMKICTGSAVYRTNLLRSNGITYTEECINGEDQEFVYKALSRADKIIFLNKTLFYYVQREGSISNIYNVNRFDVINALKRTVKYFEIMSNRQLEIISNKIKGEKIIANYFCNLDSCLTNLMINNKMPVKQVMKNTYVNIENKYPGLSEDMVLTMKSYKGTNKRLLMKIKVFLNFPVAYYWLINLKSKIKSIKKRVSK